MSVLATLQPRVPAPSKRHFVFTTFSRSKEGTSLHRISFRFRSTDDSASLHTFSEHSLWLHVALREPKKKKVWRVFVCYYYLFGSIHSLRLTIRGPMAPLGFFSQPTLFGHAVKRQNKYTLKQQTECCTWQTLFCKTKPVKTQSDTRPRQFPPTSDE